jgi:crossover junction endodeoxyribonuclease RusA
VSGIIVITLPIPPKELSPNGRFHHMVKARAVKRYRQAAHIVTVGELAGDRPKWKEATAQVRWYTKTKRRPDADNALSSMKPVWDSMQDAGLLDNDRGLTHKPIVFAVDKQNPRVVITVEATNAAR